MLGAVEVPRLFPAFFPFRLGGFLGPFASSGSKWIWLNFCRREIRPLFLWGHQDGLQVLFAQDAGRGEVSGLHFLWFSLREFDWFAEKGDMDVGTTCFGVYEDFFIFSPLGGRGAGNHPLRVVGGLGTQI